MIAKWHEMSPARSSGSALPSELTHGQLDRFVDQCGPAGVRRRARIEPSSSEPPAPLALVITIPLVPAAERPRRARRRSAAARADPVAPPVNGTASARSALRPSTGRCRPDRDRGRPHRPDRSTRCDLDEPPRRTPRSPGGSRLSPLAVAPATINPPPHLPIAEPPGVRPAKRPAPRPPCQRPFRSTHLRPIQDREQPLEMSPESAATAVRCDRTSRRFARR